MTSNKVHNNGTWTDLVYYEGGFLRWKHTKGRRKAGAVVGGNSNGYTRCQLLGRQYAVHRLVWAYFKGVLPCATIDHIDGNRSNNRIENLRLATQSENNMNYDKPKNNTSGFRGVYLDRKSGTWYYQVQFKGKVHSGWGFVTSKQASEERHKVAFGLVGGFVWKS